MLMPKKSKIKKPSLKDEVEVQQLEVDSPGEEVQEEVVEDQVLLDDNKDKAKAVVSFKDE